jgi:hypothetical protein
MSSPFFRSPEKYSAFGFCTRMVIAPYLGFWMEREMAVPEQSTGTDPVYGVMICGHGSRSKSAVTEFAVLAEKLAPNFSRLAG